MTFRICEAPGCDRPSRSPGSKHCERCRARLRRGGTFDVLPPAESYSATHRRLYGQRGNAKDHACRDCGEPAAHWAMYLPPPEAIRRDKGNGYLFTHDLSYYVALCHKCHGRLDGQVRRVLREVKAPYDTPAGPPMPFPADLDDLEEI